MSLLRRWRPAVRIARRELRRRPIRTGLTGLLVLVPVLLATAVAGYAQNTRWSGERAAHEVMGGADALVKVTPWSQTRARYAGGWLDARPVKTRGPDGRMRVERRPADDVELAALLPDGAQLTPVPRSRTLRLSTGGRAFAWFFDATDPLVEGTAPGVDGDAPDAADEVAVARGLADALGLLDGDDLRPDATLTLADGHRLHVVGLVRPEDFDADSEVTLVLPPTSPLAPQRPVRHWLVDLPDGSAAAARPLVRQLSAAGVAMMPRDSLLHPGAWGDRTTGPTVDLTALLAGALVLLVGFVEIVLVVGAAFAVGARRQVRDLGLVAATGGAPSDVRRTLLAQGLVVGVGASGLGVLLGVVAFRTSVPAYEAVLHDTLWTRDIPILSVVGIGVLGALISVAAALVPAWSIGRLTPVQALSGRFQTQSSDRRAPRPALAMAAAGIAVLAGGGLAIARTSGDGTVSSAPVLLSGVGFVLLVAGVGWASPYAVALMAGLGRLLPLSGRYSFRDAARHRFRSAAAVVAMAITVTVAVLVGFFIQSAAAQPSSTELPPDDVLVQGSGPDSGDDAVRHTVTDVFGSADVTRIDQLNDARRAQLGLMHRGTWLGLGQVDEAALRTLVDPADLNRALAAWHNGTVVIAGSAVGEWRPDRVVVGSGPGSRRVELPALVVHAEGTASLPLMWVSPATATAHRWQPGSWSYIVNVGREVSQDELTQLAVRGIDGYSTGPDVARTRMWSWAGIGAAGLLATVIVGIAVALAAAESRPDQATLAAIGAGPGRRRRMGATHGLFLGLIGGVLGMLVGGPSGLSFVQLDGLAGTDVPWGHLLAVGLLVPVASAAAGWLVTPGRLSLIRRTT
jgi:putative ABC transport system permease protein